MLTTTARPANCRLRVAARSAGRLSRLFSRAEMTAIRVPQWAQKGSRASAVVPQLAQRTPARGADSKGGVNTPVVGATVMPPIVGARSLAGQEMGTSLQRMSQNSGKSPNPPLNRAATASDRVAILQN